MKASPLQEWSIVLVDFPFAEIDGSKVRPALVVRYSASTVTLVKITSWGGKELRTGCVGLAGNDLEGTGLTRASLVDLRAQWTADVIKIDRVLGRLPIENASLRRRFVAALQYL